MDIGAFYRQSRLIVVIGKGGVGKTTATAALATSASLAGLSVLVTVLDDRSSLARLFGVEAIEHASSILSSGAGERATPAEIRGQLITSNEALTEYLMDHGLRRVARRLAHSGALDVVASAIPGIREVLVLGKLKQLVRDEPADLLILDAPSSGHAIRFLTSSSGLVDAARSGPLRAQAEEVVELLADPARCQVMLVTVPEETPVNEAVETAFRLEDEVGVALGPIVVNGCYPVLDQIGAEVTDAAAVAGIGELAANDARRIAEAAAFRRHRQELQCQQVARLAAELPLPQLVLPYLFATEVEIREVAVLAAALSAGIERLS